MNWFKAFMLVEIGTWVWMYRSGRAELLLLQAKQAAGQPLTVDEQRQLQQAQ